MAGVTKVTALVRWSAERPNRGPGESWSLERRPASIQATTGEPSRSSSMTSWTPRFGPNGRGSNGPCVTANNGTRPEDGPAAPGQNPRRRVGGSFDQGRPALSLATVDSTGPGICGMGHTHKHCPNRRGGARHSRCILALQYNHLIVADAWMTYVWKSNEGRLRYGAANRAKSFLDR